MGKKFFDQSAVVFFFDSGKEPGTEFPNGLGSIEWQAIVHLSTFEVTDMHFDFFPGFQISDFPENTAYVKFSPDGRHVLLSRQNRPSEIWDIETGKPTQSLTGSQILIRAETFSPDGRYVFSGSEDGTTRIWEVKDEPFARTAESSNSFRGLGTLASFKDGSWAVVDPNGR